MGMKLFKVNQKIRTNSSSCTSKEWLEQIKSEINFSSCPQKAYSSLWRSKYYFKNYIENIYHSSCDKVAKEKHMILWGVIKGNWLGQSDQGRLIWEEDHWANVWRKIRSYLDQRMQFRPKELHVQKPCGKKQYSVLQGLKKGQCGNRYRRSGHGENRGG